MAKTKQTPRKSDVAAKLKKMVRQPRPEWGTAAETFYKRPQLPMDPVRQDVSYKGMSDMSNSFI